jgi:protein-S-isoprenylcysteine O-methyltransferase Ste14
MQSGPFAIGDLEVYAVLAGWLVFALLFLTRKRSPGAPERRRDRRSFVGIALQAVGYATVWAMRRGPSSAFLPFGRAGEIATAAVAVALMAFSLWLTHGAIRELGRQWSIGARLIEGHELVTGGPYRLVRHPIYTGMLGMLLATGLALSRPAAVGMGAAVYLAGAWLRVHVEEHLLVEAFGSAYREYARRVPALIPGWPGARG